MINGLIIGLGILLLAAQTLFARLCDAVGVGEWAYPSFVLPIVLYLAVGDSSLGRGATLSFVLGYLTDAFSGLPLGLHTFLMQVLFLLARVAGLKLFLHGKVFQSLLTFFAAVAGGTLTIALHVVFERAQVHLAMGHAMLVVTSQAVASGVLAPVVFAILSKLPGGPTLKAAES
ncbi:MAG: rod shape-determining protein MreD [Deltaproteobacteria bacterium]|nr:rod shape-determining protein MreD [Deltaproteobacteria bacterium]